LDASTPYTVKSGERERNNALAFYAANRGRSENGTRDDSSHQNKTVDRNRRTERIVGDGGRLHLPSW